MSISDCSSLATRLFWNVVQYRSRQPDVRLKISVLAEASQSIPEHFHSPCSEWAEVLGTESKEDVAS